MGDARKGKVYSICSTEGRVGGRYCTVLVFPSTIERIQSASIAIFATTTNFTVRTRPPLRTGLSPSLPGPTRMGAQALWTRIVTNSSHPQLDDRNCPSQKPYPASHGLTHSLLLSMAFLLVSLQHKQAPFPLNPASNALRYFSTASTHPSHACLALAPRPILCARQTIGSRRPNYDLRLVGTFRWINVRWM